MLGRSRWTSHPLPHGFSRSRRTDVKAMMDRGETFELIDVRTEPGARCRQNRGLTSS